MSVGTIKRGDVYWADLSPVLGAEEGGMRPVVIVSNDTANSSMQTVIAVVITSKSLSLTPTRVPLSALSVGVSKDSVILTEQLRTLDRQRLKEKIGALDENTIKKVDNALRITLELG